MIQLGQIDHDLDDLDPRLPLRYVQDLRSTDSTQETRAINRPCRSDHTGPIRQHLARPYNMGNRFSLKDLDHEAEIDQTDHLPEVLGKKKCRYSYRDHDPRVKSEVRASTARRTNRDHVQCLQPPEHR